MPISTRFINRAERKTLWSVFLFQLTLMILSWYFIESLQSNNECYTKLKRDYDLGVIYINVPNDCTWWTVFWFRLNRYTILSAVFFFFNAVMEYYIPKLHLVMYMLIWQGILMNSYRAHVEDNVFYRDAPVFLLMILGFLYLEIEPFRDLEMLHKPIEINKNNDERLLASEDTDTKNGTDVIIKVSQCDDNVSMKKVIKQADNGIEKNESIYQLFDEPMFPEPEQKKISIYLLVLIRMLTFLLVGFSLWNHILIFYRFFYLPFHREKPVQTS